MCYTAEVFEAMSYRVLSMNGWYLIQAYFKLLKFGGQYNGNAFDEMIPFIRKVYLPSLDRSLISNWCFFIVWLF